MKNIMRYLRDPVWQAVGALLAVIAILITLNTKNDQKAEVIVYAYHKIKFENFQLPSDRVKLVIQGTKEEISRAVVDYFIIINKSNKAIVASEIIESFNITATNKTERILLVSSCDFSSVSNSEQSKAPYVNLTWQKKNSAWVAIPALLNSDDRVCVTVISEEALPTTGTDLPAIERLKWGGRVVNTNIKIYKSTEEYNLSIEKNWKQALKTEIYLSGYAAYWFAIFQIILFLLTLGLALRSNWLTNNSKKNTLKLCILVLICTATAEIFTDIFVNLNLFNLHEFVWAFLLVHFLFILYFLMKKKIANKANIVTIE